MTRACTGVQAVSLDEEDLAREFSGAVRLTVHVQEEVTLTPEQASPAQSAHSALLNRPPLVLDIEWLGLTGLTQREERRSAHHRSQSLGDRTCSSPALTVAALCVQIKKMTDRDIARLWSQYVKELAVLLVRAEGTDPPQEVIARMEELVCRELLLLYIRQAATDALAEWACRAFPPRNHMCAQ